ncbi:hypothetical protein C8R43DRAFT_945914 [Mycena crocata]|nr:hypothetical protein C8R43DRAFT_945914 [Mycena crocata]
MSPTEGAVGVESCNGKSIDTLICAVELARETTVLTRGKSKGCDGTRTIRTIIQKRKDDEVLTLQFTDSETSTMGQYWHFMNLDKRQTTGDMGKLGEFLFSGYPSSEDFVEKFRIRPQIDAFLSVSKAREVNRRVNFRAMCKKDPSTEIGLFATLPVEIMHEIFLHLEHAHDVAIFAITCQYLWEIGLVHMNRRATEWQTTFSCAGDRVICAGDYLDCDDDIPEGLLTSEEQKELCLSLYIFCMLEAHGYDLYDDDGSHAILRHLANPAFKKHYRPIEPGILRNLSKCQYVRESALRVMKEHYTGTEVRMGQVNLGEIIMMRICFSSDPSVATPWEGGIHRGVWTGDRFDIVENVDWLTNRAGNEPGWMDVTDEVMEEFEDIWRAEYPGQWGDDEEDDEEGDEDEDEEGDEDEDEGKDV